MEIEEVIKRECCTKNDLKAYQGKLKDPEIGKRCKPVFCIHCVQIWLHVREMGPAGSMEPSIKKIAI